MFHKKGTILFNFLLIYYMELISPSHYFYLLSIDSVLVISSLDLNESILFYSIYLVTLFRSA